MKEERTKIGKRKFCALLTIFVIIANMFSPYSELMHSVVAASPEARKTIYCITITRD